MELRALVALSKTQQTTTPNRSLCLSRGHIADFVEVGRAFCCSGSRERPEMIGNERLVRYSNVLEYAVMARVATKVVQVRIES